jgi:myo-inositol-1(or 4)-monophosphatase
LKSDNSYIRVAIEAARAAGRYALKKTGRFGRVSYKGSINLVTDVDKRSEEIIVSRIRKEFPGHSILAEERGLENKNSSYRWIIDPLDGTTNYAHSFPFFCVSVGLEIDGKVVAGVVYEPTRDELFSATSGNGARLNKKRIHVSKTADLSKALLVTGFAYNIREAKYTNVENFRKFLLASQAVRRTGSAAIDLCYVACARFDGFWEVGLNPWDTAAGSLILSEAGGKLTDFKGSPYSIYEKKILASNGGIHKQMLSILKKG